MTPRGFTLVEVLVAVVVLQLATLGALSTLTQAVRVRLAAEHVDARSTLLETLADSLRAARAPGTGRRALSHDTVTWSTDSVGDVTMTGRGPDWRDSMVVRREWWIDGR